jgi:hypothetical protein
VMAENFYIVLLHSPVYDKKGRVSVTSIANMDIHDIARCARTFGVKRFYIVSPLAEQRKLAEKILCHWQSGFGSTYNPSRKEAFALVDVKENLDEVLEDITCRAGKAPRIVATGARLSGECLSAAALRDKILAGNDPHVLLFGTGWGLTGEILERVHHRLEPIQGPEEYNHLPVRAAVAILLDRLWGK